MLADNAPDVFPSLNPDNYSLRDVLGDLPPDGIIAFIVIVLLAFLVIRIIFR